MSSAPSTTEFQAEHKRSPRHRVDKLAYVDLGPENGGMVIDVSNGGISFQGIQPLTEGQFLQISFKLPGISQSMQAGAQVVWLNDSGKGGGLRFVDIPDQTRELVDQWLSGQAAPGHREVNASILAIQEQVRTATAALEQAQNQLPRAPAKPMAPPRNLRDTSPSSAGLKLETPPVKAPARSTGPVLTASPAERPGSQRVKTILLGVLVSAAILAVAAGVLVGLRPRLASALLPAQSVAAEPSPVELKIGRNGSDWQISWNRTADVVLKAIGGHLTIVDGQNRKELDLDPVELRGGSILYTPDSEDLLVRLQLVSGTSTPPVSVSVRVIAGGSAVPAASPVAAAQPVTFALAAPSRSGGSLPAPAPRGPEVAPQKVVTGLQAPSLPAPSPATVGRLIPSAIASPTARPAPPEAEIAPPADAVSSPELGARLPRLAFGGAVAPVRPTTTVPAQLVDRREPVYPAAARTMGISGPVELAFTIGGDGAVKDVRVTKGHPVLGSAATEAVLRWRYEPARLNGIAVETQSSAVIVFQPPK